MSRHKSNNFAAATLTGVALVLASTSSMAGPGGNPKNGGDTGAVPPGYIKHTVDPENTLVIRGVFRDFRAANVANGHPDFGVNPTNGRGIYFGMLEDELAPNGDPVCALTGFEVTQQYVDAAGRPVIGPKPYITDTGDTPGVVDNVQGGACESAQSMSQWFTESPGINTSAPFPIMLDRIPGTDAFVYDGDLRTQFAQVPGFGGNKVYEYTFQIEARFLNKKGEGDALMFGADDAMWVYIDGKLVADLGGGHDFEQQYVELDRLDWLKDNEMYYIKVFYAERKKGGSRFQMATTMPLNTVPLPAMTGLAD